MVTFWYEKRVDGGNHKTGNYTGGAHWVISKTGYTRRRHTEKSPAEFAGVEEEIARNPSKEEQNCEWLYREKISEICLHLVEETLVISEGDYACWFCSIYGVHNREKYPGKCSLWGLF